jgi:heptosyltransferase-2
MGPFPGNPAKILVRSTNWIGDAVMTTPALRSVRAAFPDSEITLLAYPWVGDIFRYSPRVDRIIAYEKRGRHRGLRGLWQLAKELRQEQFDCAILFQNAFEAALLAFLARIPVRGGYATDGRSLLLTHRVYKAPNIVVRHEVLYYQRILRGLGIPTTDSGLEIFIPGFEIDTAKARLHELTGARSSSSLLIGFNPGAAFGPAKRWPAARYAELAVLLSKRYDAHILLFGSTADQPTTAEIIRLAGKKARLIDLAGKTRLIGAMALIGECDAFVTNDSGLMHIAAALHTPQVALFGSTDHIATGPYSASAVVVRKELPCSPCKKKKCPLKHFQCMKMISSEEVFSALVQMLY